MEITIDNTKYKCEIFNIHEILDLEKNNPKFIHNLETSIRLVRILNGRFQ